MRATLLLLVATLCFSAVLAEEDYEDAPWGDETSGDEEVEDDGGDESTPDEPSRDEDPADSSGGSAVAPKVKGTIAEKADNGDWKGVLKMLAEGKHDVNAVNEYQESVLHMTNMPHNAQPEALKKLIAGGADVNMQDADGCTPVVWAVHNNHYENAKMLLDAGADVTIKDKKGRIPKDHALSQKMRSLFAAPGEVVESPLSDLTVANFAKEVQKSESDVVIYAYTPTCGYCRDFSPIYDELAAGLRRTSLKFMKLDVSREEKIPKEYMVDRLPSLLISKIGATQPLFYEDGPRTVKAITTWLQKKATHKIMFTRNGEEQEAPSTFEQEAPTEAALPKGAIDGAAAPAGAALSTDPPAHDGSEL